jgi:Mg-chelatase subunit ChlD
VLWAAPAILLALLASRLVRRRRFVGFSDVRNLQQLGHRPSPIRRLPTLLAFGALAAIVGALMEPVVPFAESKIEAQGLDIVLVVDLSASMTEMMGLLSELPPSAFRLPPGSAPGVRPAVTGPGGQPYSTRLDATKRALRDFIARRRNDRIGLVVFSDNAYVISPLTFDYEYLRNYVDGIDDTLLKAEGMTAIGEGIHLANVLLARQSEKNVKNKVIVVLTDGEHNIGRDPIEALGDSDAAGVRAHLIGIDLEKAMRQKPAVAKLIETVRAYGGQYFQADSPPQLLAANRALSLLEKGRLAGRRLQLDVPIFTWLAMPALVLLVCALGLRVIPYFTDVT